MVECDDNKIGLLPDTSHFEYMNTNVAKECAVSVIY